MKTRKLIILTLLLGTLVLGSLPLSYAESPEPDLKNILQDALNDEYTARDSYQAVLDTYGNILPFSRIVKAEQKHVAAIERIAERYEIELIQPTEQITAPGSIEDSIAMAIDIEETDIKQYQELIDMGLPADVTRMFTNLLKGSENHLKAFTNPQAGLGLGGSGRFGKNSEAKGGGGAKGSMNQAQYIDEDGDGVCDHLGSQLGPMGGRNRQGR